MKRLLVITFLCVFLVWMVAKMVTVGFALWRHQSVVYIFKGVKGPNEISTILKKPPALWTEYRQKGPARLAILLTQIDSEWLGLAHGLKSIGIPFEITTDYKEAFAHSVVMVYPEVSGTTMNAASLRALAAFSRQGGTLMAFNVLGGGLQSIFGFGEPLESTEHTQIVFNRASALCAAFTDPKEQTVPFAAAEKNPDRPSVVSYSHPVETPLATYEDGSAAITQQSVGTGHVYAWGLDLGALLLKGYNNREENIARSYVNDFEPTLDVFLRLIKAIYVQSEKRSVSLGTVPNGKSIAVLITHDIDFTRSVENSLAYADYEKEQGIEATYFLQTKYIKDFNDDVFFNQKELSAIQAIAAHGMEVASHSVSHSKVFRKFPLGSGDEKYPAYRPFVQSDMVTDNGSILGELRVSKFLIEKVAGLGSVVSFRPGHLSNPYALPQALEATGYHYSSSVTANNSLTHLPFQLDEGRETTTEIDEFEFPITVEDEAPPEMVRRLPQALALAEKIRRYHGLFVILIHPNIVGQKMQFEQGFVSQLKPTAWFGTVAHYGAWWHARNKVQLDVSENAGRLLVTLNSPEKISGLTLQIPRGWVFQKKDSSPISVDLSSQGLLLGDLQGQVKLVFKAV